jgi:hypothetical protein
MEGWIVMADVPGDVQRWTAKRRVALVLSIVRRATSVAEAARKHGLTVAEVEASATASGPPLSQPTPISGATTSTWGLTEVEPDKLMAQHG